MPTMARVRDFSFVPLLAAGALLVGCAGDATAPTAAPDSPGQAALAPVAASFSKGADTDGNGTYTFTIDPSQSNTLRMGPDELTLPANAVCRLADSGYGAEQWDLPCKPERGAITITARVQSVRGQHSRVSFEPAMRFNPHKTVNLSLHSEKVAKSSAPFTILYCGPLNTCVDESVSDQSMETHVDAQSKKVSRRIKHFSGYVVTNYAADAAEVFAW